MFVLAIDIETSGSSLRDNGILSIGASLQNLAREELEQFVVNIALVDGRIFEESCKKDFWDKNPKALEFVSQNAINPREAMGQFRDFVDRIQVQYPNLTVISDNPSFDIAWIDNYLTTYADRKPLRYSSVDNKYTMIWDSASVQKTWCSIKTHEASVFTPSKDHRKALQLELTVPKDHNPLNDARNIAGFYIQTLHQMSEFKESLPKAQPQRVIKLEEHNPAWKHFFQEEKAAIERVFSREESALVDVLHVGSTSVEGLIAKPIIDIIVVVKDPYTIDQPLTEAGYRYKGEYNLPMRRMFGKKGEYEVYMHVYEEGNPEVALNLTFREFLRGNVAAKEEYSALKTAIVAQDATYKTTSTGITTYNLEKSGFIQKALVAAGFDGLCMRLCAQDDEWAHYKLIRSPSLTKTGRTNEIDSNANTKHIVLVKGVEVVAAAQVNISEPNAFIEFLGAKISDGTRVGLLEHLLGTIEKWVAKIGVLFVTTFVAKEDSDIFECAKYTKIAETGDVLHMMKYLGSVVEDVPQPVNLAGIILEEGEA